MGLMAWELLKGY